MSKPQKSGPAIFMYCVIAVSAVCAAGCFFMYYSNIIKNSAILWCGIVAFMVMYHLWLRIIMGNVTKLFNVNCNAAWFKERAFEKRLYKLLKVKNWKDRALTYNPELFSLADYSPEQVACVTVKSELDHWVNEIISVSALLFSILWGQFWIFLATSVAAMLFDAQFIVIQRYNRPRLIRLAERRAKNSQIKKESCAV